MGWYSRIRQTAGLTIGAEVAKQSKNTVLVLEAGVSNLNDPDLRVYSSGFVVNRASLMNHSASGLLWIALWQRPLRLGLPDRKLFAITA